MANRPAFMTQGDAEKLFKAARVAGYNRTRIVSYPDGRREVIVETVRVPSEKVDNSDEWDDVLK
ncbi:hypothetical protein [Mesorhizobium sp. M4B.F.Ca.ET.013.02.1.1]|uniref:hypothetical protein n=1 Tax=Mesorhizobium sp. M4B.F.Ca.ET.013.02.1.1 TaxID=2496755 RepID=UPI000FD52131|nr:hypothetical protein [Mesorhizobium sp. M4B.F.Ca.ET.013.02.1.1]RUW26950.1 hypothetical protein EOA34_06610 [Mesorhizobium sp. M4B.F.Ca.ET.013.02.1.1]